MRPLRTLPFFSKRPMISPTCRGGGRRRGRRGAGVRRRDGWGMDKRTGAERVGREEVQRGVRIDRSSTDRALGVSASRRARTYPRWTPSGLIMMYVRSVSKRPARTWNPPRADALAATAPRASAATPCARGLRAAVARADFAAGATRAAARTPERRSTEARAGAATRAAEAEMARTWSSGVCGECARRGVPRGSGGRSDRAPSCGDVDAGAGAS